MSNLRILFGKVQYLAPIVGGGEGMVTAYENNVLDGVYVPTQVATDLVNNGKATATTDSPSIRFGATLGAITDDQDPVNPTG